MKTLNLSCPTKTQHGIVLLEGLIAIVIFSIGMLGIIGLQASMVKSSAEARARAEASYIAQKRIATLWADPDNLAAYAVGAPGTSISSSSALPKGRIMTQFAVAAGDNTTCGADPNCAVVTVTWQQPGSPDVHNFQAIARVKSNTSP
jgi:type IV pilus assembly protein PilV